MLIMKYMYRIGVQLIEFHEFWYMCVFQGLNRKIGEDIVDVGVKVIFQRNLERRTL